MANRNGKSPFYTNKMYLLEIQEVQDDKAGNDQRSSKKGPPTIIFGKTQGRKGHKLPRINMGFSLENHAWIRLRSRQRGMTITEYVNELIDRDRTGN